MSEAVGLKDARRPVSRVLSAVVLAAGRPFLWDAPCGTPHATNPDGEAGKPLHPCGHRRPYSVLLPVGFTLPPLLPGARCAFAAPFRPCLRGAAWLPRGGPCGPCAGGLFSVALSLGSPPPAVSRHRIPVEPGLSSVALRRQRPSGRLAWGEMRGWGWVRQAVVRGASTARAAGLSCGDLGRGCASV
jgi:hypothetical protein